MNITWLDQLLQTLQALLAGFGVPEASRPVGALMLLYLFVTLAALIFVVCLWRISRRPGAAPGRREAAAPSPSSPAGACADSEMAATAVAGAPLADTVLDRLRAGLGKTRASLVTRLDGLFREHSGFSRELMDELEEILITSDFGMPTTAALIACLQERFSGTDPTSAEVYQALKYEVAGRLRQIDAPGTSPEGSLQVIMVVGVNGVGKTTTIGKLASRFVSEGKKVLLGAGDTFRAAAADQLDIWSKRAGADLVRHSEGGDPAAVAYDAIKAAIGRKSDILILDTAGRLHTKANLMEELKKIRRVLGRELAGAPHQSLLVVDATTGQNALAQARLFSEAVAIDGIVLTKLDGTAKGGIVVAISSDLQIPVRYIGVGEGIDDLRPFDAELFAEALFAPGDDA